MQAWKLGHDLASDLQIIQADDDAGVDRNSLNPLLVSSEVIFLRHRVVEVAVVEVDGVEVRVQLAAVNVASRIDGVAEAGARAGREDCRTRISTDVHQKGEGDVDARLVGIHRREAVCRWHGAIDDAKLCALRFRIIMGLQPDHQSDLGRKALELWKGVVV